MTCITRQHIGKLDPETGQAIYDASYLERQKGEAKDDVEQKPTPTISEQEAKNPDTANDCEEVQSILDLPIR